MHVLINDTHLGVVRSAGTTPASALELRKDGLARFSKIVESVTGRLTIVGDLFDTYQVPMQDLLATYEVMCVALDRGLQIDLIPGNHDLSTDSNKMGSCQFLASLLSRFDNFTYQSKAGWLTKDVYVIPHLPNQDIFDLELGKVPECQFLLVHCNYDNYFARESDHSLNMSKEQAQACKAKKIVFAHEHNHRMMLSGKVFVMGNQFPTSVADCLSEQNKYYHVLKSDGEIERIESWNRDEDYAELDWQNPAETAARFVRFVGRAASAQAADAAEIIGRYRRASPALVVSNAVKIDTPEGQIELEVDSLESVRSFDVMTALKKFLKPEEYQILEALK